MKMIGYIQGLRIRGPVNLGPLGTIDVAGVSNLRGLTIMYAGFITAGTSTFGGPVIAGAGLSVAGLCTLGGEVICSSSLAIAAGGLLTIPQRTVATQLPAADPTVAGELWVNAGVVNRSAG